MAFELLDNFTTLQKGICLGICALVLGYILGYSLIIATYVFCFLLAHFTLKHITQSTSIINSLFFLEFIKLIKYICKSKEIATSTCLNGRNERNALLSASGENRNHEQDRLTSETQNLDYMNKMDELDLGIPEMEAHRLIDLIIRDFIKIWYYLISHENLFIEDMNQAFEQFAFSIFNHFKKIDKVDMTKKCIYLYYKHLKEYDLALQALKKQPKYRKRIGPIQQEFKKLKTVSEGFQSLNQFHIAVLSEGIEQKYLKAMVNIILKELVLKGIFSLTTQELVVDSIATNLIPKVINLLSDSNWLHRRIISLLSESKPRSLHLRQKRNKSVTEMNESIFETLNNIRHLREDLNNSNNESHSDEATVLDIQIQDGSKGFTSSTNQKVEFQLTSPSDINFDDNLDIENLSLQASQECYITDDLASHFKIMPTEQDSVLQKTDSDGHSYNNTTNKNMIVDTSDKEQDKTVLFHIGSSTEVIRRDLDGESNSRITSSVTNQDQKTLSPIPKLSPIGSVDGQRNTFISQRLFQVTYDGMDSTSTFSDSSSNISEASCYSVGDSSPSQSLDSKTSHDFYRHSEIDQHGFLHDTATQSTSDLDSIVESNPELPQPLKIANIHISSTETMKHPSGGVYTLYIIKYCSMGNLEELTVRRRFREFVTLHDRLEDHASYKQTMKGIKGPNRWKLLPFQSMEEKNVEKRKHFLEHYLQTLASKDDICQSLALREFLAYNADASLAFVKKASEIPRVDKVFVKTVSGMFNKISTALPNLPRDTRAKSPSTSKIGDCNVQLPDDVTKWTDSDNLDLVFDDTYSSRKNVGESLEVILTRCLHAQDDHMDSDSNLSDSDIISISGNRPLQEDDDDEFKDAIDTSVICQVPRMEGDGCDNASLDKGVDEAAIPLAAAVIDLASQTVLDLDTWPRQLTSINVFKVVFGKALDGWLQQQVTDLTTPERCALYIQLLTDSIWPEGELAGTTVEPPSDEEKNRVRAEARETLSQFFPALIHSIIGENTFQIGIDKIMASLDHPMLNRHLAYCFFDLLVEALIPEISTAQLQHEIVAAERHSLAE